MLGKLFTCLYPIVAIISLSGFLPQIKSLIRAKAAPLDISVRMWLVWIVGSSISLGYGVFALHDFMFCFVTGSGLLMMVIIVGLVIYNRYVRYGHCRNFGEALIEYFFRFPYFGVTEAVKEAVEEMAEMGEAVQVVAQVKVVPAVKRKIL